MKAYNPTYERSYGAKYELGRNLSTAGIAKLIRADIKEAVRNGDLPDTFAGYPVAYAVTIESFAGGSSIDVTIRGVPESTTYRDLEEGDWGYWPGARGYTPEVVALKKKVEGYLNAYNYDGSEIQVDYFDVNYYGSVEVESDWRRGDREAKNAARRLRKAVAA